LYNFSEYGAMFGKSQGATTFSMMTLSITTLSLSTLSITINKRQHSA
jgi:hypothetical protein